MKKDDFEDLITEDESESKESQSRQDNCGGEMKEDQTTGSHKGIH